MTKRYSIAEAKNRFARIVREAERGAFVEIDRRGAPAAFLVSPAEFRRHHPEPKGSFYESVMKFRKEHNIAALDITPEEFPGPRDRSTGGREFSW